KSLPVKIELFKTANKEEKFLIFENQINVFPNDEETFTGHQHDIFDFQHIIFRLSCHGYTGYNCEYAVSDDINIITDFNSGIFICNDPAHCSQSV
ncbi:hypothetical protein HZS_7212, partial [Henneguya salminicola]